MTDRSMSLSLPRLSCADSALMMAAMQQFRLAVLTDIGVQTGYLMGLDPDALVLFGPYARSEETYWTTIVVPRTLLTIVETHVGVGSEEKRIQELYHQAADDFLRECSAVLLAANAPESHPHPQRSKETP